MERTPRERHLPDPGVAASILAVRVRLNVDLSAVEAIIVGTVSLPDLAYPSTACLVQCKRDIPNAAAMTFLRLLQLFCLRVVPMIQTDREWSTSVGEIGHG